MKIMFDCVNLELQDKDAQIVKRALDAFEEQASAFEKFKKKKEEEEEAFKKDSATLVTTVASKDAEIATLKTQIADAAMTPAKLDAMVKDRMEVITKAKALVGDKLVIDGATDSDIRRQVVNAFVGDAAKGWDDNQISTSFATITIKPPTGSPVRDMAMKFDSAPVQQQQTVIEDSYKKYNEYLEKASRAPAAA